ncbi:MAG: Asp23/Gls24 family envelope stress response protein [Solirubrobacterales bacterium]|nr:Asp23/Gls24 family envelope stress response protein [Solirubrobacterales bacterium]
MQLSVKGAGTGSSGVEQTAATMRGAGRTGAGSTDTPLRTEHGQTTIADTVVTKVANVAAREVRGVYDLGGGVARAVAPVTQRVGVSDERMQGVSVEVGERQAAVDLVIVVEYGESIPRVSDAVRENVIKRIEGITGLSVTEVNISINDLYFPGDETQSTRVE